jgi:hypothetical protein
MPELQKLEVPPGVYRNGTNYQSMGRWYDCNLVRWQDGIMQPVGGWLPMTSTQMTGVPRGVLGWIDNTGDRLLASGSASKLYAVNEAMTVTDITPAGLTTGNESSTAREGYGGGLYDAYEYGTPRDDATSLVSADTWSLDTWGEYLVGCLTSDGKLYQWTLSGTAAAITNAPTNCSGLVATEERFLFALGADNNNRKVAWCDQENNTTWAASSTNQAGSKELATNGSLMAGVRVRGQTLVLSDVDAHAATYIGPPFIYQFTKVGSNCGLVAPNAVVALPDGNAMWMSYQGQFYMYDGAAVREVPCDLVDYLKAGVNWDQKAKITAWTNTLYSEVWFGFQSSGGTDVDKYIAYNFRDRHWTIGELDRCGGVDAGVYDTPAWVSTDGYWYQHETGYSYEGADVYAQSGPVELNVGRHWMWVTDLIPDENTLGDMQVSFVTKSEPTGSETTYGPFTPGGFTNMRFSARQVSLKVEAVREAGWRWGTPRIEAQPAGQR